MARATRGVQAEDAETSRLQRTSLGSLQCPPLGGDSGPCCRGHSPDKNQTPCCPLVAQGLSPDLSAGLNMQTWGSWSRVPEAF